MAQLHFTLDSDFFVGLFSETKDEAFGKLMEALLNQVLQDDHNDWSVSHRIFDMKEYYDKLSSIQSNLLKIKAA